MTIRYEKYYKYGAYHWKWYYGRNKKQRYIDHVNYLKKWIKEKNALEIGAGDGLISHELKIKGIDNEPRAITLAESKGARVTLGDAHKTKFKNNEFDAVLLADTLEHLDNPKKALHEARRILKNYLYIAIPVISRFKEAEQHHEWTPETLKEFVESEGFTLEEEMVIANRKIYAKFKKNANYHLLYFQ